MFELAGEQRQRVHVQRPAQLLLAQTEEVHQLRRLLASAQNSWFSPPNTSLTEPSVKIWRIELVSRSAQESHETLSGAPGGSGIVSVTTTCSKFAAARFSHASPEKTPWVAAAYTLRAPASWTAWAAALSVPAVSMMSSTSTAVLPLTSPMMYPISATCWAGRSLLRIARSAPIREAKCLFSFTRPASGATTTRSSRPRSAKYWVSMKIAVMWSQGFWKKPWIWPE